MYLFFLGLLLLFMLTLFDVLDLCNDDGKLREWLRGYGVLVEPPSKCSKCSSGLKASVHRGKPGLVCTNQKCRLRVAAVVDGLLEGSKLSLKKFVRKGSRCFSCELLPSAPVMPSRSGGIFHSPAAKRRMLNT